MNKLNNKTEIRRCECGCGKTFECDFLSIKRFIHGHNNRGKSLATKGIKRSDAFKEKIRLFNLSDKNPRRIKREVRICACGCGEKFIVKINSVKKFVSGHNSRLHVGIKNPCYGKRYSDVEKKRISNSLIGIKRTNEQKINYSLGAFKRMIKHPESFGLLGKRQYIYLKRLKMKIYCHSSYEVAAALNLDKCKSVVKLEKDKVKIRYTEDSNIKHYIVDFKVYLCNAIVLVEVKSEYTKSLSLTKLKAGEKYAKDNDLYFQVWTKDICFNLHSVETMLNQVIDSATASAQNGRRYSPTSLATARTEEKSLSRLEEEVYA